MNSKNSYWLETVVCSARKGVDARLERMLEARQEMRRRTEGCIRGFQDLWTANLCFYFKRYMLTRKLGIEVPREFQRSWILVTEG